jgi:RimJ/RimL family protein N-acetyltransferase
MRIIGQRITLRDEPQETGNRDFFRWRNLEEWDYYDEPWTPPPGQVSWEEWECQRLEREKALREPSMTSHVWQIDTVEGKHMGWVLYYDLDTQAGRATVGVCLPEEDTWGQGYGTEAVRLLLGYMFHGMGLAEMRTGTWTGNVRMMRVAHKCGFVEIDRHPHDAEVTVRGEALVIVQFALTRARWFAQESDIPSIDGGGLL